LAAAGANHNPTADPVLQFTPAYEFDQRIDWQPGPTTVSRLGPRRAKSCLRPPTCPRAGTLASAPAPKYKEIRAEHPVATEYRCLTRTTDPTTIRLA